MRKKDPATKCPRGLSVSDYMSQFLCQDNLTLCLSVLHVEAEFISLCADTNRRCSDDCLCVDFTSS